MQNTLEKVLKFFAGSCDIKILKNFNKRRHKYFFLGSVSDEEKIEHLKDSQLFTILRRGTAFINIGAIASGLPIISTKVGSIPEITIDDVNGYVIALDSENLASI